MTARLSIETVFSRTSYSNQTRHHSGVGEHFLDSDNVPDNIKTFYLTTTAGPSAIGVTEQLQHSRATLLLDFSRPGILDFSKLPSLPTENASQLYVWSASEAWFTAFNARLSQLFNERRTGFDWLHKPVYDLLVLLLGIPFALWLCFKLTAFTLLNQLPIFVSGSVYVYVFLLGVSFFRVLFSYSRWVFPKIELQSDASAPFRHRALWAAVIIGVLSAVIWDALKAL
jgi:hypothetical protein